MSRTQSLAACLRAHARRSLDRVEPRDDGRNARRALALLDAACYAESLPEDDSLLLLLREAGHFGPHGLDDFEPDEQARRRIAEWTGGEPAELLLDLAGRLPQDAASD
ncbi:hypothetical protein [Nonomuraea sp. NPDC050310]|uniref:hypothetical protein n=1 Tax=unclassified Nonomuraea TaxID=2593643 RepID=UPI0033FC7DEF